jgi:hypothetical protein
MHIRDPRNNPKHRERGPKKFRITYADIARAAGRAVPTVLSAVCNNEFDPDKLESLIDWCAKRRGWTAPAPKSTVEP